MRTCNTDYHANFSRGPLCQGFGNTSRVSQDEVWSWSDISESSWPSATLALGWEARTGTETGLPLSVCSRRRRLERGASEAGKEVLCGLARGDQRLSETRQACLRCVHWKVSRSNRAATLKPGATKERAGGERQREDKMPDLEHGVDQVRQAHRFVEAAAHKGDASFPFAVIAALVV